MRVFHDDPTADGWYVASHEEDLQVTKLVTKLVTTLVPLPISRS